LRPLALFSLISARYEPGGIILTSNKGFGEWGEVLDDAVVATAILDRLLQAGLFGVSSVPLLGAPDERC